jgi:AraC family transcriptional regulator
MPSNLAGEQSWQRGSDCSKSDKAANALRLVNRIVDEHEPEISSDAPSTIDPVMTHLERALVVALARPAEASPELVNCVRLAMLAHLSQSRGRHAVAETARQGGLSARQQRRATEYLANHFSDAVSLADLAKACGLSCGHLARAFRHTTGLTPHRWLQRYRVARAKEMLQSSNSAIADIAVRCGFADQSHFTRVFKALEGTSPAAWRRWHAID